MTGVTGEPSGDEREPEALAGVGGRGGVKRRSGSGDEAGDSVLACVAVMSRVGGDFSEAAASSVAGKASGILVRGERGIDTRPPPRILSSCWI